MNPIVQADRVEIMVDGRSVRAAIGQAALAKENRGGQSENRQMAKSPSCPRLTKNPENRYSIREMVLSE